jgi:phosphoglycolate phosphatase
MREVLERLAASGIAWGIVTNKPGWLARPMLAQMDFHRGSVALVTGDCLPVRKPDPAPVLLACTLAGIDPASAVMIGDDLRDVQAGFAAGMATVAAAWGYLGVGEPVGAWGAQHVVHSPDELLKLLGMA